ncbi:alanine racemase [Arthrobacter cupressi]|uniref:D-serine deaminase, pyridoxal phosphate-dependent n=1 Tax=Arthrobacter cupressi TaxID=1045773 RepID=A0A1G8V696_9MICC|nr:alanine racemase [Arthrobacter cupressi]NYD78677.1 D-serine deaminase-like pyridoxal phosphate-dependent protein [Arthrobacter cupressi]SDJ61571.1 D-serine deaminase, pyridoxal phosphate-dependent [Arthrobacter cupressi]
MPVLDPSLPLDTLPQMLLDVGAIERNIAIKEAWTRRHGMVLAPHIKTTMTGEIVRRQLPGCWGVTVATTAQAAKAVEWGATRILIVNEVLFRGHLEQLRSMLEGSPELEIYALADSAAGVAAAAEVFRKADRPLKVLIDVGITGGRTGIRAAEEAGPLAALVSEAGGLLLAGVSAYEGVAPNARTEENLAAVDSHCRLARDIFESLEFEVEQPVFTVGGSAFQDRAAMFLPQGAVNVLRSGCYVVHDHGTYAGVSPVPGLEAAAVVRALVVSAPEPGRVILNAGKRELAYDAGLPVIVAHYRGGELLSGGERSAAILTKLFDHHAIVDGADGFAVGDVVDLGISHPCSVFDRWREVIAVAADGAEVWKPAF